MGAPFYNQPHIITPYIIWHGYFIGSQSPFKGLLGCVNRQTARPPSQGFSHHFPYGFWRIGSPGRPNELPNGIGESDFPWIILKTSHGLFGRLDFQGIYIIYTEYAEWGFSQNFHTYNKLVRIFLKIINKVHRSIRICSKPSCLVSILRISCDPPIEITGLYWSSK